MESLMTVDEVAQFLRIKPEVVRRKVRIGQMKGYKIGKAWRFSKSDLNSFLENCLR